MSKKVISYSLYGSNPFYCEGAINNAKRKCETYGSEWETWFYVYEDVPQHYVEELEKYADKIIHIGEDFPIKNGTMWRFLAIDHPDVDIMLVRDIDSIPIPKEKQLVDIWLNSGFPFHIIRDGSTHGMPFLACSFGIRKNWGHKMFDLFNNNPRFKEKSNIYIWDQLFLAHVIYPLTEGKRMVHDSWNHYELDGWNKLERTVRHIGEKILENGKPEGYEILESMENRFLYFHRQIDIYNTEQLGAFLYELMENLQIARKWKRTLVIPNCFIAPRNNEKILSEKHIYLKSVSLVPITEFLNLDEINLRYVKLLPLAEFYEKTYQNPAICFINPTKTKKDEVIVDNKLLTPFGKMNVSQLVGYNTFGLHSVNLIKDANIQQLDTEQNWIIIDNGRLGQPNWHSESIGMDYFLIRMSIEFIPRLQEIANRFVDDNNIRTSPTLMVHWRRGDRLLTGKNIIKYEQHDKETDHYYNSFTEKSCKENMLMNILKIKQENRELKQVFLVHNNSDISEVQFIKDELSQFGIGVIEYIHNIDEPFSQQYEGMIQQLIGAQCKYQLHGPTQYERMSAFGRWMIEERKRYYFNKHYITTMEVFDNVYFI